MVACGAESACVQEGDGVHAAFDGYPFVYGFDEVVTVLIDDAVAVEDDEFHGCSPTGDAKWFFHCSNAAWKTGLSRL